MRDAGGPEYQWSVAGVYFVVLFVPDVRTNNIVRSNMLKNIFLADYSTFNL